jgi:hypothetical protein
MMLSRRFMILFSLSMVAVLFGVTGPASTPPAQNPNCRLAVLVIFDQLRGDYLTRWDSLFTDDGFHRLEKAGAWFQNCHYPYASTVTGAGHASISTGCTPRSMESSPMIGTTARQVRT